ncbi:hypothetical protein ALC60_12956 [Trachymyrmex zeteki]|uniref:Uncharacterized protein n=1 Tax=Mycetomoellerius zeteki TaxID=64791 RepID=A0A151WJK8_9HYME|nr:hypothetical protein ALC60_12956 [Trachymyrmex zeteki]
MRVKERREPRRPSAEESGPCQQLPPSRKKKWQLPWLDGAYETIIPPPYLVLYVWTSSVQREGDGWGGLLRLGGAGRGEGERKKHEEEGTRTREREREREGGREEWDETDSVEKSDVGRGETTWVGFARERACRRSRVLIAEEERAKEPPIEHPLGFVDRPHVAQEAAREVMLLESRGLAGRKRNGLTLTSFGDGGGGGGGGGGGAGGAGSEEDDEESRHHLYLGRKMQGEGTAASTVPTGLSGCAGDDGDESSSPSPNSSLLNNLNNNCNSNLVNRDPTEVRHEKKPVVHHVLARPGEVSHRNSGNGRGRSPGSARRPNETRWCLVSSSRILDACGE